MMSSWWRKSCTCILMAVIAAGGDLASGQEADEKKELEAEYQKRLERADPDADPKQHKNLASWCKRNYPEKHSFHQSAYNEFLFGQLEARLPAKATAVQLKQLQEEAAKLELPEKSREYLARWGEMQFAVHSAKLKPGDLKMMQALLKWSSDNGVEFIEPAKELAGKIVGLATDDVAARKVLGHLQIDGEWKSPEDAFAGIDLKDPAARVKLHEKLAASAPAGKRQFPANPVKGMEKAGNHYFTGTAASGGQAKYFLCVNGYSKSKPTPLVISLHGGGSGGYEKAREYASLAAVAWSNYTLKGGCITIAPVARKHVTNSWGTLSNFEDLIDAIEETMERFNIDRKRIYVTGQSMGGGGTSLYYLCFPEMTAASCARAGYYFRDGSVTNVLGKPIMVIHGEKDEEFRTKSRDELVKQIEDIGGKLTHVSLPDVDHAIYDNIAYPRFIPYFEEHVNDIEPDFRLIRAAARAYFRN
jgi:poly(3-hydroxybutyrate) depolymerase